MNEYQETVMYDDFERMPLFSGQLANLDLLQGITNYGFERPSEIQQQTIVPIHRGRNVIGQAQSGRGKTGAFVIGLLSLLDPKENAVQAIIMANTHELAMQTHDVLCAIGQRIFQRGNRTASDAVTLCIGRQVSAEENIGKIRRGAQVLVGTPGRIRHLVNFHLSDRPLIDANRVRLVVLDEADCLLMNKFRDDVIGIIDMLDPPSRRYPLQLAIFSATFSDESLDIARKLCVPDKDDLGDEWTKDPSAPVEVLIPTEDLTLEGIEQYFYEIECAADGDMFNQKADTILTLNDIQMIPVCIIYVNSRGHAMRLTRFLNDNGMSSECIYGAMPASDRRRIIQAFRKGEIRILITTDLLARGFDVQQVELVINFDLPYVYDRTADINQEKLAEYLHRIGRGGRFGRRGLAINLVGSASERARKEAIESHYSTIMNVLPDDISGLY